MPIWQSNKSMPKALAPLLVLAALLTLVLPASAQAGSQLDLYHLETSTFPTMTASLDVYDEQGRFVSGLFAENFTVWEDNNPLPATSLEERQLGVQLVVAVNAGPSFASRNEQGISRYDRVSQFLQEWGNSLSFEMGDDLSLVVNGGNGIQHVQAPQQWLAAFSTYQPDSRNLSPSLQTLSTAIDVVAAVTPQPGMKRSVLFITPMVTEGEVNVLQNLAARAAELKIHVFTWVIGLPDEFIGTPSTAIKDLAIQTGGQYYVYSGTEGLPNPEEYLAPLRHTYELTYTSAIFTSGSHTLTIQVGGNGGELVSTPLTYDLDVQPPNPILVLPPEQIVRQMPGEEQFDSASLVPAAQELEAIIEFPDGHPRSLQRTALYVDGQLVAENTTEPFDYFVWDISGYIDNGQHNLQVEAVDSLGLSKTSLGYPITVTVLHPAGGLLPFLQRNTLWLSLGGVGVAGIALTWILIASGRRRSSIRERRRLQQAYRDPLTQPVSLEQKKPVRHFPWQRRPKPAPAHLARLKADGKPSTAPLVALADQDITFGNDPVQAIHVLDDPSVSPLHARIRKTGDGSYLLMDQKSVAGTWVNMELVPPEGQRLCHGDVIRIGRVSYRFLLQKPPEARKPRIIPLQDNYQEGTPKKHG
jgi:hypothetical protein